MAIDWEGVSNRADGGKGDTYSTLTGRRALELIVGEENVRNMVDYWISQQPGCFTVESVLSVMRPKIAMDRCYEIYKAESDSEDAVRAVFLLASFADDAALPWVGEFLDDRSSGIRWNGLAVLRAIIYGPLGDAAVASVVELLAKAERDSDPRMQERARQIRAEFVANHPYVQPER
jgi:hypothetical protein